MDLKGKHDPATTGRGGSMKDIPPKATPLAPITSDTDAEQAQNLAEDDINGDADAENENENNARGQGARSSVVRQPTEASQTDREDAQVFEVVRRDLLLGP